MSRRALSVVLVVVLALVALPSCKKGSSLTAPGGQGGGGEPEGGLVPLAGEALVLAPEAPLYAVKEGRATVAETLARGQTLILVDPKAEAVTATLEAEGREASLVAYRVQGGSSGYCEPSRLGLGRKAVLLGDKVATYAEAKSTKATGSYLSGASLVAATTQGVAPGFVACEYWDAGTGAKATAFVERSAVSDKAPDLGAAQYIARAAAEPGKAKDLLEEARQKYPASAFEGLMAAELSRLGAEAPKDQAVVGTYEVVADNVGVRDSPDAVFGAVLATVEKGTVLDALEVSSQEEDLDGAKGRWIRVAKPAGWVFGGFLKERP